MPPHLVQQVRRGKVAVPQKGDDIPLAGGELPNPGGIGPRLFRRALGALVRIPQHGDGGFLGEKLGQRHPEACSPCSLTGGPRHIPAAENMEMQMEHALSRLLADVGDHPIAVQALLLGQLGDDLKDVGARYEIRVPMTR